MPSPSVPLHCEDDTCKYIGRIVFLLRLLRLPLEDAATLS